MIDLAGKVAVVTGSAAGIGAATAKRFATLGASVVIADLNGLGAQMVVDEITAEGGYAVACQADVRDEEQVHAMVMIAVEAFGGLDVLHNNAANMSSEIIGNDRDVETMTVERWDETFAVALRGAMLGCKHAVPLMRRARWRVHHQHSFNLRPDRRVDPGRVRRRQGRGYQPDSLRGDQLRPRGHSL